MEIIALQILIAQSLVIMCAKVVFAIAHHLLISNQKAKDVVSEIPF
jgi:hypothetical protein